MVAHKHAQRVPRILVVRACTDLNAVIAGIVIPARSLVGAIGIDAVGVSLQVVNTGDAVISQYLIGLSKDGVSHHALLRRPEVGVAHLDKVCRLDLSKRVSQTCELQGLREKGELVRMVFHLTGYQHVGAADDTVDLMQDAVLQLIVHAGDGGGATDKHLTRLRVDAGVDVPSQ